MKRPVRNLSENSEKAGGYGWIFDWWKCYESKSRRESMRARTERAKTEREIL